ncbi:MAG TPA: AbrB/MazE/SpoVT family DNA-binding domain-containing protein [Candidatus Aminicenantes bacterium]|nr:AbrB/MazE/SpoVT family DNA-binding domain-containing protein [Candidatus Aminicenantes bacterium]
MSKVKAYQAEIRARGQLTIPKKIRDNEAFYEGASVSVIPVGDSLLVTPHKLELDEARREIRRIMKAAGVRLEDLIEALGDERRSLAGETYGSEEK